MKKNVLLFVSVLVLSLSSCSKDDKDTEEPALIVGTWDQSQFVYIVSGEELVQDYTPVCSGNPTHIVFNSNGEGFYNIYNSSTCALVSEPLLWSQSGQNLTIEYDNGEVDNVQVTQLNETTLKLFWGVGANPDYVIYRRR